MLWPLRNRQDVISPAKEKISLTCTPRRGSSGSERAEGKGEEKIRKGAEVRAGTSDSLQMRRVPTDIKLVHLVCSKRRMDVRYVHRSGCWVLHQLLEPARVLLLASALLRLASLTLLLVERGRAVLVSGSLWRSCMGESTVS